MSDVSKFNGHDIKDKVARQNIANLELSKAIHTDVEEAVNAVNEVVEEFAGNLENLETLFNNAGLNNSADGISYDNTTSGLEAENVQVAIDKLNEKCNALALKDVTAFPFTATTGTGGAVGNAIITTEEDYSYAIATNITTDGYRVVNVMKHSACRFVVNVVNATNNSWADNATISGTLLLFK